MRRTRLNAPAARILAPFLLGAGMLLIWQAASALGLVPAAFLPSPLALAARLVDELGRGTLVRYAGQTLLEAIAGTLLAVLVALPLGWLIARFRWVDAAASPYVAASQAVPAIAVAPLLALWIGYGLGPISILCAIIAFFPMLVTTVLGLRGLDPDVLEAATLDGAGTWQRLRRIEAPLALPSILAGIRAGAALSVTGAVVGEFTMGGRGLGMLLTLYRDANDVEGLFAALLALVALAILLHGALGLAARCAPTVEAREDRRGP